MFTATAVSRARWQPSTSADTECTDVGGLHLHHARVRRLESVVGPPPPCTTATAAAAAPAPASGPGGYCSPPRHRRSVDSRIPPGNVEANLGCFVSGDDPTPGGPRQHDPPGIMVWRGWGDPGGRGGIQGVYSPPSAPPFPHLFMLLLARRPQKMWTGALRASAVDINPKA
jgi:hypothetical protein